MKKTNRSAAGLRRARVTGFLLVALVVVPGLILGWMAIRAADREEAVVEKQLQTTLLAEVTPAADRIAELLGTLQAELAATVPDSVDVSALGAGAAGITEALRRRPGALDAWSETEPLVAVPFLFRRTAGTFLWPAESSSFLSSEERAFLDRNLDFFQDRRSVEVFSNIATDFADEKLRADASRNVGTRAGSVASAGAEPNAEADAETGVRSNADGTAN
ncbi:MAG: hypothetical protein R3E97_24695, partial [Candidatus Eisenbacteria bacterium]